MITLMLTRGQNTGNIPLDLPATPAEIGEAYAMLDTLVPDDRQTHVASANTGIAALDQFLRDRPMNRPGDYAELGELAGKIDRMDDMARKTFDGALAYTPANSVADVLHIADSLSEYTFMEGASTVRLLGKFLVESGYKDFPESVRPYLDYHVVGREYHAEHAGTFTEHGYILRRDIAEPEIAEREKEPLFRVHLRKDGTMEPERPYLLELPASGAQLRYAADCLHIADLAEARIVKTECVRESLQEHIPLRHPSVDLLCDLADHLELALSDGGESKLLAVLAAEKPSTLEETLSLVMGLDSYELIQCSQEEYGRDALMQLCGDLDVVNVVDGFMDWDAFGAQMMEEDGIVATEYGAIRRASQPAPEQAMSQQMLQF